MEVWRRRRFALSVSTRMPWFKKSKKSRQPSKQTASLGIPTHIAGVPLGISADLAPDINPEGVFRSVRSTS